MFTGKAVLLANPNFAKLYKKLTTQYLTSNGATKEVAKKFNDESFLSEKSEYLEALIIYNGIKQMTLESRQYLNFQPNDPELKKFINKNKNNIRSEGGRKEDIVTIFGLKDDDLYKLVKEINSKSIIPNAKQLEKLLSQQIDDLKSSKINLTRNKTLLNENLMEYFKILKNNLANLWILNEEFKCHHEMKKNTIFINYFSGLIESIELKARVHLYETLREVYDDDTVKMLRTIRYLREIFYKKGHNK
ncbi:3529_t:CDS:2 [Entrophospora sp. SA101]|nr:3529_t:CDS:2 [Entrophospora sp. SA101]